jgi:hypothetical protein
MYNTSKTQKVYIRTYIALTVLVIDDKRRKKQYMYL